LLRGIRCLPRSLSRTRSPTWKCSCSADIPLPAAFLCLFDNPLGRFECVNDFTTADAKLGRGRGDPTQCCVFDTTGKSLRFSGIVSSAAMKNILVYRNDNQAHNPFRPEPAEGRFAIVTKRGLGMRWTRQSQAFRHGLPKGTVWTPDERALRTAKSCGPGAATLALRWQQCRQRGQERPLPRGEPV
jgi:hypothetical protein